MWSPGVEGMLIRGLWILAVSVVLPLLVGLGALFFFKPDPDNDPDARPAKGKAGPHASRPGSPDFALRSEEPTFQETARE